MSLPIFSGLTKEQVQLVLDISCATVKKYEKGQWIQRAHEQANDIMVLLEGRANVISVDRFGNDTVNYPFSRGTLMGGAVAYRNAGKSFISVETSTEAVVLKMPYEKILQIGGQYPSVLNVVLTNIMESYSKKMIIMMEKVEVLSQRSLKERIIVYLQQQQYHQHCSQVSVPGRVQMAKKMCCHRSALTRELSVMREEGILEFGSGWMKLNKTDL